MCSSKLYPNKCIKKWNKNFKMQHKWPNIKCRTRAKLYWSKQKKAIVTLGDCWRGYTKALGETALGWRGRGMGGRGRVGGSATLLLVPVWWTTTLVPWVRLSNACNHNIINTPTTSQHETMNSHKGNIQVAKLNRDCTKKHHTCTALCKHTWFCFIQ